MFHHTHPYQPFIPKHTTKLIVGTLPPPRFTTGILKPKDVAFSYGSIDGLLWPVLEQVFQVSLDYETTDVAISQRKALLKKHHIGICDIVDSAFRDKVDASDAGMRDIKLRDLIGYLEKHKTIHTLLFTGGNSKNGPEYFFRKHLKEYQLKLEVVNNDVPRIHQFTMPSSNRMITTVSLTSPSGSANRAVGSIQLYKDLKKQNPKFNTIDFRVLQYRKFFTNL
ncbi:uracil-DNA glycosylase family protein [Croceibacter atlanticus]|uniref:uracil-DNA glycosylase family protein n=1 Tax=Croceibacter atlanticus TaxID=313588 RepID=UPI0024B8F6F7|nr:uracil-DNA glycosylase family protein [Croceibacter atlanticus]